MNVSEWIPLVIIEAIQPLFLRPLSQPGKEDAINGRVRDRKSHQPTLTACCDTHFVRVDWPYRMLE